MLLALAAVGRHVRGWNKRPLTVEDFFKLCRRFKVSVHEIPLRVQGMYMVTVAPGESVRDGRPQIYIDNRLRDAGWLYCAWHEIGHLLLHTPESVSVTFFCKEGRKRTKEDREAEAVALIAVIPFPLMQKLVAGDESLVDHSLTEEMLAHRCELFRSYGI